MPTTYYKNCRIQYIIEKQNEKWRGEWRLAFDFSRTEKEEFEPARRFEASLENPYEVIEQEILRDAFAEIDDRLKVSQKSPETFPPNS